MSLLFLDYRQREAYVPNKVASQEPSNKALLDDERLFLSSFAGAKRIFFFAAHGSTDVQKLLETSLCIGGTSEKSSACGSDFSGLRGSRSSSVG